MKAKGTSSLYTCGVRSKTPTNCKENWRSLRPWREIQGSHGAKQQHKNYNCNCKLQKFATISPPLTSIFIQQLHLLSYNSVPPIQILHSFIISWWGLFENHREHCLQGEPCTVVVAVYILLHLCWINCWNWNTSICTGEQTCTSKPHRIFWGSSEIHRFRCGRTFTSLAPKLQRVVSDTE